MESKHIFAIIIACVAICVLIAVLKMIKGTNETPAEESSIPAVSAMTIPAETEDFWDALRRQQEEAKTTAATTDTTTVDGQPIPQTDVAGNDVTTILPEPAASGQQSAVTAPPAGEVSVSTAPTTPLVIYAT